MLKEVAGPVLERRGGENLAKQEGFHKARQSPNPGRILGLE